MRAIAHLLLCFAMVCSVTSASAQQEPPDREATEEEMAQVLPPLMRAAWKGQVDEVRRLLKEGADVNQTMELGISALMLAASCYPSR